MSSQKTFNQRRTLKSLAKTQFSGFEDVDVSGVESEAGNKNTRKASKRAAKGNTENSHDGDIDMDDEDHLSCVCGGFDHEHWVACDNKACNQWYGFECAGIDESPAGKWFCALCRPRPVFPNLPGAPKVTSQEVPQRKSRVVSTVKASSTRPKPWMKGWIEVPDEEKGKMQEEVEAQWAATVFQKRTRRGTVNDPTSKRRFLERTKRNPQLSLQVEKAKRVDKDDAPDEDDESMIDGESPRKPPAVPPRLAKSPVSELLVDSEEQDDLGVEASEGSDNDVSRYDRENTFEGFSDPEATDDMESVLDEMSVVYEGEEDETLASADQPRAALQEYETEADAPGNETMSGDVEDEAAAPEIMDVSPTNYSYLDLSVYGGLVVRSRDRDQNH